VSVFERKLAAILPILTLQNIIFPGSSGKWVGAFVVSDDREKSFGAPEAQISPQATQIWASAQAIFLSKPLQKPDLLSLPTHYPEEPFSLVCSMSIV